MKISLKNIAAAVVLTLSLAALPIPAGAQTTQPVDIDLAPSGGWWISYEDGRIESGGGAPDIPTVAVAAGAKLVALVPAYAGYWAVTNRGDIISVRGAVVLEGLADYKLNNEIIAAASTEDGKGLYLLGSDGGVFAFGNARFFGSLQGMLDEKLGSGEILASDWTNAPVAAIGTTSAGYWLIGADGGVFSFGNAPYQGSIQSVVNREVSPDVKASDWLDAPIIGVAPIFGGSGYLMFASDGGIFSFGGALFHGSIAGITNSPAVAVDITEDRLGYVILTADGNVWRHGNINVKIDSYPTCELLSSFLINGNESFVELRLKLDNWLYMNFDYLIDCGHLTSGRVVLLQLQQERNENTENNLLQTTELEYKITLLTERIRKAEVRITLLRRGGLATAR